MSAWSDPGPKGDVNDEREDPVDVQVERAGGRRGRAADADVVRRAADEAGGVDDRHQPGARDAGVGVTCQRRSESAATGRRPGSNWCSIPS